MTIVYRVPLRDATGRPVPGRWACEISADPDEPGPWRGTCDDWYDRQAELAAWELSGPPGHRSGDRPDTRCRHIQELHYAAQATDRVDVTRFVPTAAGKYLAKHCRCGGGQEKQLELYTPPPPAAPAASPPAAGAPSRNRPCPCGSINERGLPALFKYCHAPDCAPERRPAVQLPWPAAVPLPPGVAPPLPPLPPAPTWQEIANRAAKRRAETEREQREAARLDQARADRQRLDQIRADDEARRATRAAAERQRKAEVRAERDQADAALALADLYLSTASLDAAAEQARAALALRLSDAQRERADRLLRRISALRGAETRRARAAQQVQPQAPAAPPKTWAEAAARAAAKKTTTKKRPSR